MKKKYLRFIVVVLKPNIIDSYYILHHFSLYWYCFSGWYNDYKLNIQNIIIYTSTTQRGLGFAWTYNIIQCSIGQIINTAVYNNIFMKHLAFTMKMSPQTAYSKYNVVHNIITISIIIISTVPHNIRCTDDNPLANYILTCLDEYFVII